MTTIRELKRDYRLALAEGRVLHTVDRSISVPFSTGNPLFDSALTNKLQASATLNEAERLRRSWNLVRNADEREMSLLCEHRRSLLNDYKMLAAVESWRRGDTDTVRKMLGALPWRWKFAFPIAVIKPSAHVFTGWRKDIRFRLIDEPNFEGLFEFFRDTLARAPGVAILKYQATIKQSAALMRYRFEGERERAIHDLCFNRGKNFPDDIEGLEPIPTYLKAREFIKAGDIDSFLTTLENGAAEIPITSFMGLIGSQKIRLWEETQHTERLRAYAVRCATAVESLLRLAEWGDWLSIEQADAISAKVRHTIIERGIDIPFFKILKGFIAAPRRVKEMILHPLLIPLLHHFGETTAKRLHGQPITFVQPGNMLSMMSFVLYTVLASATDTKLLLLYNDSIEAADGLDVNEVASHLVDTRVDFETWLKSTFGGLATTYRTNEIGEHASDLIHQLSQSDRPLALDVPKIVR